LALIPPSILLFVKEPDIDKDLAEELLLIASNVHVNARGNLLQNYLKEVKDFDDEF
jgi:hypothetical protein